MTAALPRSSVGFATGYRGIPRVSTARATAFYCTWRFHGKFHGCVSGTCRGSLCGNLRETILTTRGKTTATATAYSMATSTSNAVVIHGNQQRMPRHSTAISTVMSTAFLPRQVPWVYVEIDTELHSCCNANFHRRQTTATSMAFRGHPRQLPRKFSNTRQLSRTSTAIATDGISANVSADVAAGFHGRIRR